MRLITWTRCLARRVSVLPGAYTSPESVSDPPRRRTTRRPRGLDLDFFLLTNPESPQLATNPDMALESQIITIDMDRLRVDAQQASHPDFACVYYKACP